MTARVAVAAIALAAFANAATADATPTIARFSVAPSSSQAGAHPDLRVAIAFSEPAVVKNVALHLPAGLTADPRAISFCPRKRLLSNLCSPASKVGSITVVGFAYDTELPVTRKIYNVRYRPGERLRLGVPIIGTYSRPGIAAELPVTQRAADKGLDMGLTGLPAQVGNIPVRVKEVSLWIKGVSRTRKRKKVVKRPFLTNPTSCTPAASLLDVTLHEAPAAPLSAVSAFTPAGCTAAGG